jgi:uncharacterized membrane protein HdeD (DUF308 family)
MENEILGSFRKTVKYWYLPLILGILFILSGIWIFITPVSSFLTLAILFAIMFFVAGIIEIFYAISNRKILHGWGWTLISGIVGVFFGILLLSRPALSMLTLSLFVGFGVLFYSIIALARSLAIRKHKVDDWGISLIISIIGIIIGLLMIWNPLFGGFTIVIYAAISFIIIGIMHIYLSDKLRKIHNQANKTSID